MTETMKWIGSVLAAIFILTVGGSIIAAASGVLLILSLIIGFGFVVALLAAAIKESLSEN